MSRRSRISRALGADLTPAAIGLAAVISYLVEAVLLLPLGQGGTFALLLQRADAPPEAPAGTVLIHRTLRTALSLLMGLGLISRACAGLGSRVQIAA